MFATDTEVKTSLKNVLLPFLVMVFNISLICGCEKAVGKSSDVLIAEAGKAKMTVVVLPDASEKVAELAETLSSNLSKITGAEFDVEKSSGAEGVFVGIKSGRFEELKINGIADRDSYIIKTHDKGIYIVGATEQALSHAVWDFLYRLGYRQFFPGENWEIIPDIETLKISFDVHEKPDYYTRSIWYGWGTWGYNDQPYKQWKEKNRTDSKFFLATYHIYDKIIKANMEKFDEHPEYYGLVDGQRKSSKICIGNPKLRQLVFDFALDYFKEDPSRDSISMDPSDGPGAGVSYEMGWCECDLCAQIGSVSDRAVFLANEVAREVNKKYEDKYVGIYAYNMHSPPPSIKVHPNVVISVATAFMKGGYTLNDIIEGWSSKGAILGIREYLSVNTWDRDLPGKSHGSNIDYIKKNIPYFYSKGARFYSSESGDNWGCNGLGYYIASRLLWDTSQAENVDEIIDDFLTRSFGPTKEPMSKFYKLIDGSNSLLLTDDLLGKMYRYLDKARELAEGKSEIINRIEDLVLYTRYVELYRDYSNVQGKPRQKAFEEMIRYVYQIRKTMMIHAKGIYRDVEKRDSSVSVPENAKWNIPEEDNPWKTSQPIPREQIKSFVKEGIEKYQILEFEPVGYSSQWLPAKQLNLKEVPQGSFGRNGRYVQTYYTWAEDDNTELKIDVTGGLIEHYRDRGNVKIDLYHIRGVFEALEEQKEVPPDGKKYSLNFNLKHGNLLYKIVVSDGGDATKVEWPKGMPLAVEASQNRALDFLHGSWNLYFYVPKGTENVVFYADGTGQVLNSDMKSVFDMKDKKPGYFSVPVEKGQDGFLWKFDKSTGKRILFNVPPLMVRSAEELMLPEEVIEKDK